MRWCQREALPFPFAPVTTGWVCPISVNSSCPEWLSVWWLWVWAVSRHEGPRVLRGSRDHLLTHPEPGTNPCINRMRLVRPQEDQGVGVGSDDLALGRGLGQLPPLLWSPPTPPLLPCQSPFPPSFVLGFNLHLLWSPVPLCCPPGHLAAARDPLIGDPVTLRSAGGGGMPPASTSPPVSLRR